MSTGANVLDVNALIQNWWNNLQPGPNWPSKDQFILDTTTVTFEVTDFKYETPNPTQTPHAIASSIYMNNSDVQDSQLFSDTKTTTATFQWSITAGVKFGGKETFKVGVPTIGDLTTDLTWEISLGVTAAQTVTTTETWQWSTNINVPSHSKLTASVVLNEAQYEPHFSATVLLGGYVGYHLSDRSIAGSQSIAGILAGHPGVDPVGPYGDQVTYTAQGVFQGVQGMGYVIETQQQSLLPAPVQAAPTGQAAPLTVNDSDPGLQYSGAGWFYSVARPGSFNDVQNDVHATQIDGDSVSYTFTGTGISYISEKSDGYGLVDVYLDQKFQQTVDANAAGVTNEGGQVLFTTSGLQLCQHTLTLVKKSGLYMVLDTLKVQP